MASRNQVNGSLIVSSTNGTEPESNEVFITANLRETKGSTLNPALRYRNICIPEFSFPDVPKELVRIVIAKFNDLAKDRFEDAMLESNRSAVSLPLEMFSKASLLQYFSTVSVSQRLTGEMVAAWFDASATAKKIAAKAPEKMKAYRDLFIKTASPNHGINPNTCTALLATMEEADAEGGIGETLAGKWAATVKKSQESEVSAL